MAVPKIVGIETELGIMVHGAKNANPVSASSTVIAAYVRSVSGPDVSPSSGVTWDYLAETPGNDARFDRLPISPNPSVSESYLVNTVLTNGARYYVDHAHPEISTPECASALSLVAYDRAAELIAIQSMKAAQVELPEGEEIVLYKDNSDRKGNAYGCHENYLLSRAVPFSSIVSAATTHFVTRQIFTGSGKVGSELLGLGTNQVPYQITQRAEHFEEEVGLETTLKRPIVNTRDEPHCDATKYRRLHVIVGDANLSQVATLLKVGTSSILFSMLEDGFLDGLPTIASPVTALRDVSHDLELSSPLALGDCRTATALEVQWMIYELACQWADSRGFESVGGEESGRLVMEKWEEILSGLESDPMGLSDQLDWVAKYRIILGFKERHGCGWDDPRLRVLDLQYHDLRPAKSLAARAGLVSIVSEEDASEATTKPPPETRAYFRGRCLSKFGTDVISANWDSIVLDIGEDTLKRIPMLEPTRGTKDHVGMILEESSTAAELIAKLEA